MVEPYVYDALNQNYWFFFFFILGGKKRLCARQQISYFSYMLGYTVDAA